MRSAVTRPFINAGSTILALACAISISTFNPGTAHADTSFSDEFTGAAGSAPNPAYWNFETGGGGWGNNEKQTYTSDRTNSRLDGDGHLLIEARRTGDNWTSARLNTYGKFSFTYGTITARLKMPKGQGLHTGFWLLGNDIYSAGFPAAGEIDIAEYINSYDFVHVGIHGPTQAGGVGSVDLGSARTALPGFIPLPDGLNGRYQFGSDKKGIDPAQFHTYGVRKSANTISFLFDDVPFYTVNRSDLASGQRWVFDKPVYAILNLAVGGTWPGATDSSTPSPATLAVDWVRYTP